MSVAFLQFLGPLESLPGVSTTELRVGILLGGLVCAVAVGYEFYSKKEPKSSGEKTDRVEEEPKTPAKETTDE